MTTPNVPIEVQECKNKGTLIGTIFINQNGETLRSWYPSLGAGKTPGSHGPSGVQVAVGLLYAVPLA